jgi:hypothetical protein
LRKTVRHGLRQRLHASPLTDAAGYRERFARAIRGAWRDRCARA